MAKLQFSSHKLASRTAKWYNTKRKEQVYKFCNQGQAENEVHFLYDCSEIDKVDLNHVNKINTLKNLFY